METAVVWRFPLLGTLGVTLEPSVTWFILAAVILDECKIDSIVILVKIPITINIEEYLDLLLCPSLNVSLAKHGIQHGQIGRVWGQTG